MWIKEFIQELKTKDKCFEKHNKDGVCNGEYGGDAGTDYLSYKCIDCKHLTMIFRNY